MYATNMAPTFEFHFTVLSVRFVMQGYWRHATVCRATNCSSETLCSSCYLDIPFDSSTVTFARRQHCRRLDVSDSNLQMQKEKRALAKRVTDGLIYNAAV